MMDDFVGWLNLAVVFLECLYLYPYVLYTILACVQPKKK